MKEYTSTVGSSVKRLDAFDKVTGRTKYTSDLIPANALTAKVLHSTIANGVVRRIDFKKAAALSGVVKVVTCFDVPDIQFTTSGNPWTIDPAWRDIQDRKLLNRRVRYRGDDIAAVIAVDELTARRALELIEVEYEEFPAVFNAREAIKDVRIPVHDEFPDNLVGYNERKSGPYEEIIKEDGLICVDKWYSTPPVKHCHLENPVSYAYVELGKITVVTSTQFPHVLRREIGQALGIPWGQVRVIRPCMGGGFGNKDDALYEPLNAFLSLQAGGRCVSLELTREEDFVNTRTRHGMECHLITHVRRDGSIAARSLESYSNQGAYASHGHAIAAKGTLAFSMIYESEAYRACAYTVYTNNPSAGAMRGYGIPQITFAIEAHMDDVAAAIGMDPLKFRRKNMMRVGAQSEDGVLKNYFDSLNQCLDAAIEYTNIHHVHKTPELPFILRGRGIAVFWYKTAVAPVCLEASTCRIIMNQDGCFTIHTGEVEIGQGFDTVFAQMAADRLHVGINQVKVVTLKDTDETPFGTGAYASRQTYVCGMAIHEAAQLMCKKILDRAAYMSGIPAEKMFLADSAVRKKDDNSQLYTYEDIGMNSIYSMEKSEHLIVEKTTNCHTNALSLGCCIAEVAVDTHTGQITVESLVNAHDCGILINPALAEAQVHGGMSMGLGYGLSEQMIIDRENGQIKNTNLLDYKLLSAMDHPDLGTAFVENAEPTSPFGTKALGEPPVLPVAPAIRNAFLDATGVAINDLPLKPQACADALRKAGNQGMKQEGNADVSIERCLYRTFSE